MLCLSSHQCQSKTGTCSIAFCSRSATVYTISKVDHLFSMTALMYSKVPPFSLPIVPTALLSLLSSPRNSLQIAKPVSVAFDFGFEVVRRMLDCFIMPIFP